MTFQLRVVNLRDQATVVEMVDGEVASGLHEDTCYQFRLQPNPMSLYADDILLHPMADVGYEWTPNFYAGQTTVTADFPDGNSASFYLKISPPLGKASDAHLAEMIGALREFDTNLLIGESAGKLGFGHGELANGFLELIQLQRMRQYGLSFVSALIKLSKSPHQGYVATNQLTSLSRIRQVHPSLLFDKRVVGILDSPHQAVEDIDTIQVLSRNPILTVDTPANRTMTALLIRVQARNNLLLEALGEDFPGDSREHLARIPRRKSSLQALSERLQAVSRRNPFAAFKGPVQTSSAGLTQIAAYPLYQKAYRLGTLALSIGLTGDQKDDLSVGYSWETYERWCLISVLEVCRNITNRAPRYVTSRWVSSEKSFEFELSTNHCLQVHFQAKFPAISPLKGKVCWSISRERYPDIVLVNIKNDVGRAIVLDAKWRSGRQNLLEAMESAHIYHDSLRIRGVAPSPCLLLAPGVPEVNELSTDQYIQAHNVGIVCEYLPMGAGLDRLKNIIRSWIQ